MNCRRHDVCGSNRTSFFDQTLVVVDCCLLGGTMSRFMKFCLIHTTVFLFLYHSVELLLFIFLFKS